MAANSAISPEYLTHAQNHINQAVVIAELVVCYSAEIGIV